MQQTQQAPRSTEKVCVSELSKLIRFGHNVVLCTIVRLALIKMSSKINAPTFYFFKGIMRCAEMRQSRKLSTYSV